MELSQYNAYVRVGNAVNIFNTLTGALIQLDETVFDSLLTDSKNSNVVNQLLRLGILIENRDDEINKYKFIQYSRMFNTNNLSLYVCPTMNCNFSCSYCFEGQNKSKTNMTEDVETAIVDYIEQYKQKNISIVWFGGEPMLNMSSIVRISNLLKEKDIKFSSSIITNGSMLNSSNIKILSTLNLEFVQISLDGSKNTHDSRRFFHSGKGSFDIIMDGIEELVKFTSIPLSIQVTIDKTNLGEYEILLDYFNNKFAKQMDSKQIQLNYNIVQNRTNFDNHGLCFTHKDYFEHLLHISKVNIKNKRDVYLPDLVFPCMFHTVNSFAIAPDGDMYKCIEHIGDHSKSVGNIVKRSVSLQKIASCFFKFNHLENSECINCSVLPVCGGGCPIDREKENGNNEISCSFYKSYLTSILNLLKL